METIITTFQSKLDLFSGKDRRKIQAALNKAIELHGNQKRLSGEPYIIHPVSVASILIDMKMDAMTVMAALLHDTVEDTGYTLEELQNDFGEETARLVNGVTKISGVKLSKKNEQEAESIRKMLIAMTQDIRVIIIKLADKLHNISTVHFLPPERAKRFARECLDIYAPLAERLGISWMKSELEDLAFKELNPEAYNHIRQTVHEDVEKYRETLNRVQDEIKSEARKAGYKVTTSARTKHIYSIYRKTKRRHISLQEISDILGIRVICRTNQECYILMGLVHSLYTPIEGKFKDYIAMPKANKYQSLHTTVMVPNGLILEIQIRTEEMHNRAEHGIAAHWAYKKNIKLNGEDDINLSVINKMKEWQSSMYNSREFLEEIQRDLLKDTIYVFTPAGQILELPKGSTPIDFAYRVHTQLGNNCIGAKVDGKISPLNRPLENSQMVEIQTSPNARPNINWLKFVKTSTARSKIRQWLNKNDENYIIESSIIAKKKAPAVLPGESKKGKKTAAAEPGAVVREFFDKARLGLSVNKEKNFLIKTATCCRPAPGDSIIGYISHSRGIIVHRTDCKNLQHIENIKDRLIEVEWEISSPRKIYTFSILSKEVSNLFSEIENILKPFSGHLLRGSLHENEKNLLEGEFMIELNRAKDLYKVKKGVAAIPNVLQIRSIES